MSNLKKKKYIALLSIVVIVIGIIGLFTFGRVDKYKGKIKIKNVVSKTTSLSASIDAVADNETQSKGTDIIKYEIGYTMDAVDGVDTRDVVIKARISDEEGRYARFKAITENNITSTLSNDGKEIEVNIDDAPLGVENNITLRLIINNAPNGFRVRPQVTVREATGVENNVVVNEVEVVTNSIVGTVKDSKNLNVSNIELSLRDENGEVKRTYSDEDGRYVFSDLENKTYTVNVEEEIYAKESEEEVEGNLIIKVKEVTPYELDAHKYITKLDLVVNGKEEHYTYKDLEKVVQNVKNARTISGQIGYKISIKNIGEKAGRLSKITDIVDEGLSFNKDKNLGWKEKDGKLYYEMAEETVIKPKETKDITLVLDIKNTNQIKTYINEADVNGETYERVVYILNGEKYREEDVILGEKLVEPIITDESFSGWYTDKNYTNKYNFKNEVTKDLILYGKTDVVKHSVEFFDKNPETGVEAKWDEKEVEHGKKVSRPEDPSHTGYTFECWMDEQENIWNFNNPVERDLRLTSCYTINKYTVIFIDGNTEYNRQQVNYKGSINVPENPTKQYYSFEYWHLDGVSSAYDLTTPVTENVTLYSKYQRNKHNITFIDKHPSTEEVVTREDVEVNEGDNVIPPEDPTKPGYTFECWAKSNGTCYDFTKSVLEDEELTSKYTVIHYTIKYNGLTNGEKQSINNPTTYTVEDEITLTNPENRYDNDHDLSEIFIGWTGSNGNDPSTLVKIVKGTTGNKEYTANWIEADPDVYPITYNLNGGSLGKDDQGHDITNPSSYTKKTATFTLNNPKKTGYNFTGWAGTDLVGQDNLEVTVAKGSRGARAYEAFYSPKDYTIEYENTCGNVVNPNSYTIESPNITLNNPSKDGYTFTGWKTEDDETKVLNVTIPTGSTGNRKYIATCEPIEYHITYELNGATEVPTNPSTYTIESPDITLNNPGKTHYTFTGWTGTGLDNITNPVVIPTGSMGDRTYTANYQLITHNVTFNDYNIESETPEETVEQFGEPVTVTDGEPVDAPGINPTHTGYTCDRWSTKINGNYNNDAYDFSSEVTSDLTLYTLCKKNSYTVTYMDGDNQYAVDTVLYKEKTTKPADDPTKNHNIFKGWTLNGSLFDFNTPITENITLYSSYEEVKAPEISHTPTEWTNQDVTVTVSKNSAVEDATGYTYKYRVEDGTYSTYEGPFSIGENCDIYAIAYKSGIASEETKHEIRNIDKIKPTIDDLAQSSSTGTSVEINFTSHDNESGVGEHRIYVDDEYKGTISYTGNPQTKTDSYEVTGLTAGQSYIVKLYAVDVAGNISDASELEITTEDRIVCQIIGRNNQLYNDDTLNEPFSTLRGAIQSCGQNQCTIQMLENVNETNDVLYGQDITLDLNGKNVSGVRDYTLDISGDFILIDDGETKGMIYNNVDSAVKIEANGKFTMGINEIIDVNVSTTTPYVWGKYYGVKRLEDATFNFYDGAVRGEVAISGEVDDAPYMYTASVTSYTDEETPYQVATLKILDDAEARIKTKYYTKLATAVAEAKKGYYENLMSDSTLDENLKKSENYDYGFVKNEQGYLVNENNTRYSGAQSEFNISLEDSDVDKELVFNIIRTSDEPNNDYAQIMIQEYAISDDPNSSSNPSTSNSYTINVPVGEDKQAITLKQGHIYKIMLNNYIYSNTPENSKFIITDMYLKNVENDPEDTSIDKEHSTNYTKQYGFDYDETTGTYTSNNNFEKGTTAFSYVEFDLTSESADKLLTMRATYDGMYGSDYGNIIIKNNNTIEQYSNSSGLAYLYAYNYNQRNYIGPYTYQTKLEAGKKYYVQFYYFKSTSSLDRAAYEATGCKDEFKIFDIRLTNYDVSIPSTSYTTYSFSTEEGVSRLVKNTEYGFDNKNRYNTYGYSYDTYDGYLTDSYMKYDLSNSTTGKTVQLRHDYYCYNTDVGCKFYAVVTNSPDTPETTDGAFVLRENNTQVTNTKGVLEPGKVNYLHFVFDKPVNMGEPGDNYGSSYARLDSLNIYEGVNYPLPNSIITEGEYGWTGSSSMSNNNSSSSLRGTTAHSYMKIDLTGNTFAEYLKVNLYGYADLAIIVNDNKNEPASRDGAAFTNQDGTYFYGDALIKLVPNQVNYVHFLSTNYNNNTMYIYDQTYRYPGEPVNLVTELKKAPNKGKGFTLDNNGYYTPGSINQGETADSYIEIDLTDAEKDKILDMNLYLNTYDKNYKYVYLSNSKNAIGYHTIKNDRENALIYYSYANSYYYYINGNNVAYNDTHFNTVLPKGNKYYVHFATYGQTTYTSDYLKIKSMTLSDSNETDFRTGLIPFYDTSHAGEAPDLPGDEVIDEANEGNFRFVGSNPSNYITFNNERWRIIGIFNVEGENGVKEKRIKIARDSTFGGYVYDSTPYGNPPVNGGQGINEWSQADLMKLLNPGFEDNEEEVFKSENSEYISQGVKSVNNSLYWNGGSGLCISGVYNTTMNCDFSSSGLSDTSKSFIDTVVWDIGAIPYNTNVSPYSIYSYEKGNKTTKSSTYDTQGIDDTVERTTKWLGKVGLPSISDYIMATGDFYSGSSLIYTREQCLNMETTAYGACTSNSDWLYSSNSSPMTTMNAVFGTNSSGYNPTLSTVPYAATVYSGGMPASYLNYNVRPTVYLSTKTKVTGGSGTYSSPYTIELGTEKNPDENYGFVPKAEDDPDASVIEQETDSIDWDKIKNEPTYGFTYNPETDEFINDNIDVPKSTASAYVEIDLTNELQDKDLSVDFEMSSYSGNAYILLMQDSFKDINYSNLYNDGEIDGTKYASRSGNGAYNRVYSLTHGKKYYVQFIYKKFTENGSSEQYSDTMKVKLNINADTIHTTEMKSFDGRVPVLNEEVDTVQILKDISLTSSLNVEQTKDMILDLNGYTLTTTANDYVIRNNGSLKVIDSGYDREEAISEAEYSKATNNYNEQKQSYIAKVAQDKIDTEAAMAEYNQRSYVNDGLMINLSSKEYGETENVWKDLSGNDLDQTINGTYIDAETGGYNYTLAISDINEQDNTITYEYSLIANATAGGGIFTDKNGIYASYHNNATYTNRLSVDQSSRISDNPYALTFIENNKFTLTLVKTNTLVKCYVNGVLFDSFIATNQDKYTSISFHGGKSLAIRTYNRALTESEIKHNFDVDNALYDIKNVDGDALLNYDFAGGASNDLIAELQDTFWKNARRVYTLGDITSTSYGLYQYVRSTKPYPFYTDFTQIKVNVTKEDISDNMYIGLAKNLPSTPANNTLDLSFYDKYITIPSNDDAVNKEYVLKPETRGDYFLVVMSSKGHIVNSANFSVEAPVKETVTYNGTIRGSRGIIYNAKDAYLNVEEGIIHSDTTGSYPAIDNYGSIRLGDHGVIKGTPQYGIYNHDYGDILDGTGSFERIAAIYNSGRIDNGFGGYSGDNNATITIETNKDYTLNNLNGFTIINKSNSKLTVNDSNIYKFSETTPGKLELNNSTAYQIRVEKGEANINNSTVTYRSEIVNGAKIFFDNSSVDAITGDYGSNTFEDAYIKNSEITCERSNSPMSNLDNVTIEGTFNLGERCRNNYIYAYETMTLGNKEDEVDTLNPKIKEISVPKINFYDGRVNKFSKLINDIPDDYEIVMIHDESDGLDYYTLGQEDVAEINGTKYRSLASAIADVPDDSHTIIKILKNIYNVRPIIIPENKIITIDYNGHSVNSYGNDFITNNGVLTLDDLTGEPTESKILGNFIINNGELNHGNVNNNNHDALDTSKTIINNGTFNMNSGILWSKTVTVSGSYYPKIDNNSTMNITGGSISSYTNNAQGSTLSIDGGTVGSSIINSGDTIITGGKLSNTIITNNNNLTISGLNNGDDVLTNINSSGSTLIENTTMNSSISVSGGTTNIKDSLIRQTSYTVLEVSGSTGTKAILDNSTIDCNSSYDAVQIKEQGTLDIINNSVIKDSDNHTRSYTGIQIQGSGNLNFVSGSISRIRGISNSGNGNIVFGTKDGEVSKTSPSIRGNNSGFNNTNSSSHVYFYDGIFAGPVNASLTSVVTEVETGYEIITIDDTLGEAKVLSGDPLVKNTTTNEEYDNLQQAFDESSEGDTLELLRDLTTLTSYPTVNIGSDVDVTFDTKGFNIVYNGTSGSFIENNGKLNIVDTNGSSIITNNANHNIVKNNSTGELSITDIDITLVSSSYLTNNAGTTNLSGITLNTHTGNMIMNSGVASISGCTYNDTKNNSDVFISNSGTIELTNNDFRIDRGTDTAYPILISNTGNVNITDGKYYSLLSTVLSNNGGLVSMNQESSLILDGAINNNNDASIIFNNGRIQSTYNDFSNQKMSLNGTSTLTQNGGVIAIKTSLQDSSKLNVYGGTYESSSYHITASLNAIITLGHKDDNIDINMALINGTIVSKGNINIYDGRVRNGTVYAKDINIEDNSSLVNDTNGTHIVYDKQIKNIEQDKEYVDIQEAINEVATGETLQLINSGTKIQRSQLSISSGKNFTLDMNGRYIKSIKENIVNNGHISITNSSSSSSSISLQIYNDRTVSTEYRLLTNNNYLSLTGRVSLSDTTMNSQNSELIVNINNNSTVSKISNYGTFTLDSGIVSNIDNNRPATMNGGEYYYLDNNSTTFTINGGTIGKTSNSATLNINDGTSTGGISSGQSNAKINNTGYLTIENITCTSCANFIYTNRNVTINGGTFAIPIGSGDGPLIHAYDTNATVNINGGTYTNGGSTYSAIITTTTNYSNGPKVTIKDVTTDILIGQVNSELTLDNVTINSNLNYPLLTINEKGKVTVKDNVSLTSTKKEAVINNGKLYVGTKDGNVSITSPVLKGETKGLTNTGLFYFYDGIISGKEAAISGPVTETETDYSVKITDDGTYKNAYLKTTADIEKVVVVNNINYDTIQAAVNAVEENKPTNMILYTNYTLEENIVIPENKTIEFYLNGYSINYNGYAFTGDGTINFHDGVPSGVGGAIYRFLANITGTEINPKDITIYQMDNGEELLPETTYKLYKLMDGEYKIVKINENEIGDYELGSEKEILRTTTGQINIKGIGEGSYKLVGSDSKELSFDISENSVSSNIRVDRYSSKANQTVHVVATLILTLQTGVIRKPFMIVIAMLLLTTVGFIAYKKYRKEDLN